MPLYSMGNAVSIALLQGRLTIKSPPPSLVIYSHPAAQYHLRLIPLVYTPHPRISGVLFAGYAMGDARVVGWVVKSRLGEEGD
jgi:hypothetical protein